MSELIDARVVRRPDTAVVPVPRAADDVLLHQVVAALRAGSISAVGDLFDLFGADVWRAALIGSGEARIAEEATVDTFRTVWDRPSSVPLSAVAARRWMVTVAVELSRMLADAEARR